MRAYLTPLNDEEFPAIKSLAQFGRELSRTAPTIWRWRQMGILDGIINLQGRPYITRAGMEKFLRRARAGEFSKPSHAPHRAPAEMV
jgi:hypothetical protein